MKKLLVLLFSILISFNSYGEWTEVSSNIDGDIFYIDLNTIRENNGFMYWWELANYKIPLRSGTKSAMIYRKGDCGIFRIQGLDYQVYKQPMGRGKSERIDPSVSEWIYPSPGSNSEIKLNYICKYVM